MGTLNLAQISEDVVLKHLETRNPGKVTGPDKLPAKFIRDGAKKLGTSLNPHYKFIHP